jgi:hypothetical protein
MTLSELIDRYWQLAYAEGRQSRQHDTEGGDAQDCRTSIDEGIMALLSRIEELETQLVLSKPLYSRRQLEAKLAEAAKVIEPFAQIADMEEQAGPIASVIVNVARCRDARSFLQSLSQPGVSDD